MPWRELNPKLRTLDLMTFTHMRICCPDCGGAGRGCDWCGESGLCCPDCRGSGWLARRRQGNSSVLVRCMTCHIDMSDGAQYDAENAMRAIQQYAVDWFAGVRMDEVLARRAANEKIAAERAASR